MGEIVSLFSGAPREKPSRVEKGPLPLPSQAAFDDRVQRLEICRIATDDYIDSATAFLDRVEKYAVLAQSTAPAITEIRIRMEKLKTDFLYDAPARNEPTEETIQTVNKSAEKINAYRNAAIAMISEVATTSDFTALIQKGAVQNINSALYSNEYTKLLSTAGNLPVVPVSL